jgi:hypothetical protein
LELPTLSTTCISLLGKIPIIPHLQRFSSGFDEPEGADGLATSQLNLSAAPKNLSIPPLLNLDPEQQQAAVQVAVLENSFYSALILWLSKLPCLFLASSFSKPGLPFSREY